MIIKDGAKMSKSKGNVVAPDYIIDKYGADTMRLYILFIGPPSKDAQWQDEGLVGAWRFIKRTLTLLDILAGYRDNEKKDLHSQERVLLQKMHFTIKAVTEDLEGNFQFNTAISRIMELINQTYKSLETNGISRGLLHRVVETIFFLLAPFTPHISEEANRILGNKDSIFKRNWPVFDARHLEEEEIEIAVLINGRVREHIMIDTNWPEESIKEKVLALGKVRSLLNDNPPKKIIYIDKKLVNIVK